MKRPRRNIGSQKLQGGIKKMPALFAFLIAAVFCLSELAIADITNDATASGDYSATTYSSPQDSAAVTVALAAPEIGIVKTAGAIVDFNSNSVQDAGDTITYSFTATNLGNVTLTNVGVTDPMIAGITCATTTLAPGASTSCSAPGAYSLSQADVNAGQVSNQATASGKPPVGPNVSDLSDESTPGSGAGKDDPTIAAITAAPKVALVKTAGAVTDANTNSVTDPGDTIAYTFTVSNLGNVTLDPVTVTDPKIPSITCPAGPLAPGANVTCTAAAPYALSQVDIDAGSVSNQATASGKPPVGPNVTDLSDPVTAGSGTGNDDPTFKTVPQTPKVALVKAGGAVTDVNTNLVTDPGDTIAYTFTVSNLGNVTLNPVTVTDPKIPSITCPAGPLAPGTSAPCTAAAPYTLTQVDIDAGSVSNQATASGKPPVGPNVTDLSDPANAGSGAGNDDPTVAPLTQSPKIGLVKTAGAIVDFNSSGVTDVGDTITYSFVVSNLGNVTLNPVSVSDPEVPSITCVATTLAPGATTNCSAAPYALTQADLNAGSASNQATATGKPPVGPNVTDLSDEGTPGSGAGKDDPTVQTVPQVATIGIVKTVGAINDANNSTVTDAGDTITYAFAVTNTGTVTLTGLTVTDPKVAGITCAATTLAPGATTSCSGAPYTILQADMNAGQASNQALASGLPPTGPAVTDLSDPLSSLAGSNTPTITSLTPTPAIGVVKVASSIVDVNTNTITDAGDTVAFSFTVKNIGTVTLHGITVTDTKVSGITCGATTLPPGQVTTCSGAPYTIIQSDVDLGKVVNQATATGLSPSNAPVSDLSDESVFGSGPASDNPTQTPIAPNPAIAIVKTAGAIVDFNTNGATDAGDTIAYTFTVSNPGSVTLNPVSVSDPKVPGIVCLATSIAPGVSTTCAAPTPYVLTLADLDAGSISNQATATGKPPTGPNVSDLSDPTTPGSGAGKDDPTLANVPQMPKIGLVKSAGSIVDANNSTVTDAGDTITYSFTVSNIGTVTLNPVSVTDPKISGIVCSATSLIPGASTNCAAPAPYTLTQADINVGSISNQATATGKPPVGPNVSDLSDPTTPGPGAGKDDPTVMSVPQVSEIGIIKPVGVLGDTNTNGQPDQGETLAYTFTVTNLGTVTVNSLNVSDPKVAGITCALTTLTPGQSTTCSGSPYIITQTDLDAGTVQNQATANAKTPGGATISDASDPLVADTGNDTPTDTPLVQKSAVGLLKVSGTVIDANTNSLIDVGDEIAYTFTVSNMGNVTLNNVSVIDPKLTNVTCLSNTVAPGATTTCTGTHYIILQSDINAGQVTNSATVTATPPIGPAITDKSDPVTPGTTSDTPTITSLAPTPQIALVKTAGSVADANGSGTLNAGDTITYTFNVSNIGNVTLHGIAVVDNKVSPVTCPLTTLNPGQSTICTAPPYVITLADINATQVQNSATATGLSPTNVATSDVSDENTPGPTANDPTITSLTPVPSVGLVKTAGAIIDFNSTGQVDAGDHINYTFTVTNTGNMSLNTIAVTDTKVSGITCAATSLAPTLSTICTGASYVLTQADLDIGHVDNQGTVSAKPPVGAAVTDLSDETTPGTGPGKDNPTVTNIPQTSSIGILKPIGTVNDTNTNGVTDANDTISYVFVVKNFGTVTLNPVSVSDPMLGAVTCASTVLAPVAQTNCTAPAYVITQADINAGMVSNTATATGKPPFGPNVTDDSDATVSGPTADNPTITPLSTSATIALVKTASAPSDDNNSGVIDVGDHITYSFTVTNTGTVTLNPISVTDAPIGPITCLATSLAPNASTTCSAAPYAIQQVDLDAGKFSNQAMATGKPPVGPNATDLSDESTPGTGLGKDDPTQVTLPAAPSITLVKTDSFPGPVAVGSLITYSFAVKNTGNVTINNISLTDPGANIVGSGSIASLAPGATDTTTLHATHALTLADINAGFYTNTGTVTGMPAPPSAQPVTATDSIGTPLNLNSSFSFVKSAVLANTTNPPKAGDIANYSFTVTNTGTTPLHNITISDPPINLGSLISTQRNIALMDGALNPEATFATADVSPFGSRAPKSGAVEAFKRWLAGKSHAPDVQTELYVRRTLVRMSGEGELLPGDKIGFLFNLSNGGNAAFTNIAITQPDAKAYGDKLSLLLPNQTDGASIIYTRDVTLEELASGEVKSSAYILAHTRGQEVVQVLTDALPLSAMLPYDTFATASITPAVHPLLNPGDSFTFTAPYALKQADVDAGNVHNDATATALNLADQTLTQVASFDLPLNRVPKIGVVKTGILNLGPDNTATPGDVITYQFDVTNLGNVTLTNVTITDPLVNVVGGPIASLAPGVTNSNTITATHALTIADINAGHYDNQATASGKPPVGSNVTSTSDFADPTLHRPTVVTMTVNPKIALLKQVASVNDVNNNGVTDTGDTITYKFTIKNVGNVTLDKVTVTDPLMPGAPDIISGVPINGFAPGATDSTTFSGIYVIKLSDMNVGHVDNTATVTADAPDGSQVQDQSDPGVYTSNAPTITPLQQKPKISLIKTQAFIDNCFGTPVTVVQAGVCIHYTFQFQNAGNVTLTNFVLTDALPTAVVGNTPAIPKLDPGQINSTMFTATYQVTAADEVVGQVSNQASISANGPTAVVVSANSDATAFGNNSPTPTVTPITVNPKISVIKLPPTWSDVNLPGNLPDGLTNAGDVLTYKFSVKNTGNVPLTQVKVTDYDVNTTVAGNPIPTLAAGAEDTTTFTATYTLTAADVAQGFHNNLAKAIGTSPANAPISDDSDAANYTANAPTPFVIGASPSISVVKRVTIVDVNTNGVTDVDDRINYSFDIYNTGNVPLSNVTLTDTVAGVTTTYTNPVINLMNTGTAPTTITNGAYHVITAADFVAGQFSNTATVAGLPPGGPAVSDISDETTKGSGAGNDDPSVVTLVAAPRITMVKTVASVVDANGNGTNDIGDTIKYNFVITNTGNVPLTNVNVVDPNAALTFVNPAIATLNPGQSFAIPNAATHLVTAGEVTAGFVDNQATVTGTPPVGPNVSDLSDESATGTGAGRDDPTRTLVFTAKPVLSKTAAKTEIKRGEQVTYTISATNLGVGPYAIADIMPPGFGYVAGSATYAVGTGPATPVVNSSTLTFNPITPAAGKITLKLKLLASTTLSGGKFTNNARLIDPATGQVIAVAQATVEITPEPTFDCSDIIGRVFDDKNGNGYMDDGEPGLPGVRLVTLNGIIITTDADGKYHVPCAAIPDGAIGSNFLLKLDPRTLPTGYRLTTENPRDVRVTKGKVTILNFGAMIERDVKVDLTGKAFEPDTTALVGAWDKGIARLCKILKKNRSTLLLVYHRGGESEELAWTRLEEVEGLVRERCTTNYKLKIKQDVEDGK